MAQSACHAIFLGYEVVDLCGELAIDVENSFQRALEVFQSADRFRSLRPMYDAVRRNNFIKNIQVSLIERFLKNNNERFPYWIQWTYRVPRLCAS